MWLKPAPADRGAAAEADAVASDPASPTPGEPASPDEFAGWRLLVVDDEATNREVIQGMLESVGLRIDLARDGVEALALVQARRYDLILMDMQMPRMDGLEATRRIRETLGNGEIPILALSGNVLSEMKERGRAAGISAFIAKPFGMQTLIDHLRRWLRA